MFARVVVPALSLREPFWVLIVKLLLLLLRRLRRSLRYADTKYRSSGSGRTANGGYPDVVAAASSSSVAPSAWRRVAAVAAPSKDRPPSRMSYGVVLCHNRRILLTGDLCSCYVPCIASLDGGAPMSADETTVPPRKRGTEGIGSKQAGVADAAGTKGWRPSVKK
jgi:hypothetical protein